ncbi:UDP-N-acetylmuramoyl-L-alanyl-D-glutamate--2,6-diaminopimelate ligase [bacterium]|nr:UDP-N-acetylmuramoyl-L-alanyl-D-glutamate--2,6-diaminopimelate ligase [bacterium]
MNRLLSELIASQPLVITIKGPTDVAVAGFNSDSRFIRPQEMFFAITGEQRDGNAFIENALAKGASVIVSQHMPQLIRPNIAYIHVSDIHQFMAETAIKFYQTDTINMTMIGVTGTNGKTTIATMIHHLLTSFSQSSVFIGTTGIYVAGTYYPTDYTTPPAFEIHRIIREGYDRGAKFLVMEVSSHALKLKRVWGMAFDAAIFTNLTHEHRELHPTMDDYFQAKSQLFDMIKPTGFMVINTDDPYGGKIFQRGKALRRISFDYGKAADTFKLTGSQFDPTTRLQKVQITYERSQLILQTRLIGEYNAYNMLAVYATMIRLGFDSKKILSELPILPGVDGRFEWLDADNFSVVIDFAHTPDGLEKLLTAVDSIRGNGRIITIFGCPGSRDPSKRPLMGAIASRLSDLVIVTTDDVHFEEPTAIIRDIIAGMTTDRYKVIEDRRLAIAEGIKTAQAGDIVVIAGRGHERFQYIKDEKKPFVDKEVLKEEAAKLQLAIN